MVLSRRWALIFVIAALLPLFAFAQQNDELRAAIRADLQNDPRSANLSQAEIDAMVEALATQAEEQGSAQDYIDSENSTFGETAIPVYKEETTLNTLAISIAILLLVLAGVTVFLVWHRAHRSGPAVTG
ncbi:MAG: hypothetical protein A2854_04165 [Parcubacteria group bacterium RIFCSPHIGHO2_01_FULL_56_18]|nr:MAG: hypothetical protein A2854_04165 [Parcubacteria group bacterium RIFCSPHIGHO2_01_FULL_56_18]